MPTITNPGVIETMVQSFLSNGMDKGQAALSVGYSPSTVRSGNCTKLWDREDVKAELGRQRAEMVKITGFTREQAHAELDENRQLALELKQPSAATQASTAKMRLYGMDQPEAKKDATIIVINPPTAPNKATTVPCDVIDSKVGISTNQPQNGLNEATGDDNEV